MRNYITNYDPFFDRFFLRANNCSVSHMMKTDIKENKDNYQLFIELPEVKKEDTRITLENGYLKVTASLNKEDENDKYENYKSFWLGQNIFKESGSPQSHIPDDEYKKTTL